MKALRFDYTISLYLQVPICLMRHFHHTNAQRIFTITRISTHRPTESIHFTFVAAATLIEN